MIDRCTKGPWAVSTSGSGEPDSAKRDHNGKPYQEASGVYALRDDGTKNGVAHILWGTFAAIPKSDGRPVGMQKYLPTPAAIAEQTANAHLIAAAPELYEALTHALEDLDAIVAVAVETGATFDSVCGITTEVRNALKKADGPMDYSGCYVCGHAPLDWAQRGDGEAQEDGVTGRVYCSAECMDKDHEESQASGARIAPCPCGYWVNEGPEDYGATPQALYDPETGEMSCIECGRELMDRSPKGVR